MNDLKKKSYRIPAKYDDKPLLDARGRLSPVMEKEHVSDCNSELSATRLGRRRGESVGPLVTLLEGN